MALDKDNMIPVNMPPNEEGNTTLLSVCHFEAPKAKEASFNEEGNIEIMAKCHQK